VRATDVLRKHDCEMAIGNRLELATPIDLVCPVVETGR
jgi:hypothetical protein